MLMSQGMNCLRILSKVRPRTIIINTNAVKYVSQHPLKFIETQNWWKEKDDIPDRWQLIYKAPMGKILNFTTAYLTASTTTVAASCLYYAAFLYDKDSFYEPVVVGDDVVIANSNLEGLIYLGAFVLFHIAVKIVLSKYVVRLYKDGDNYLAIYRGHWFNSIQKHEFHLKDFKKLKTSMIITWSEARYSLGKRHGILLDNYFKTPQDLNYLLYKKKLVSTEDNKSDEYK